MNIPVRIREILGMDSGKHNPSCHSLEGLPRQDTLNTLSRQRAKHRGSSQRFLAWGSMHSLTRDKGGSDRHVGIIPTITQTPSANEVGASQDQPDIRPHDSPPSLPRYHLGISANLKRR